MIEFDVNWLAIGVCVVANMIIGAVWYGVLAKPWLEGVGMTRDEATALPQAPAYAVAALNSLLMAFVLANVMIWADVTEPVAGAQLGVLMWLGFTGLSFAANHGFEGRSAKLWFINSGIYLVGLAVMGVILGAWR